MLDTATPPGATRVRPAPRSTGLAGFLTSRRGAWVSLALAIAVVAALFGVFRGAEVPNAAGQPPVTSESAVVAERLKQLPNSDRQSLLVVATRADGAALTDADAASLKTLLPVLKARSVADPGGPNLSKDRQAALLTVPITVPEKTADTAEIVQGVRADLAAHAPAGYTLQVTGGPAFGVDVAAAFDGADFTLLAVTIGIVAVLLIATYRSPVLWLLPLLVVALADGLAGRVTAAAGEAWNFAFDAGIVSVLVFGAGTNYALLLISRYREELQRTADDRAALAEAWRKTVPAIVASNLTVVLALMTLLFASIPMTRGIGVPAALGLLIALAAVLFLLPPLLAIVGRRVFWPFIPRVGDTGRQGRAWRAIATRVVRRPLVSLLGFLIVPAVMAAGLIGTSVGLDQLEKFRVPSESAAGLRTLAAHYPAGEAQPIFIATNTAQATDVVAAATTVPHVMRAQPAGTSTDTSLTRVMVVSEHTPGTPESLDQITQLRTAVHAVAGADAQVGGAVATELDARAGSQRDLSIVAPLVLAVSFGVLVLLLRSLVAPVLLLLVNTVSAVAAIGAGAWISRVLLGQRALDGQVPILAFLFLVALGIDYTIFLVHRTRTEAAARGTRAGIVEAVANTGNVITSAGVVLAAVFAALGVLPLVILGQLGLIVGIGVLVDTLVVRTVIVPALFSLVGERIWWPSRPTTDPGEARHEPRRDVVGAG